VSVTFTVACDSSAFHRSDRYSLILSSVWFEKQGEHREQGPFLFLHDNSLPRVSTLGINSQSTADSNDLEPGKLTKQRSIDGDGHVSVISTNKFIEVEANEEGSGHLNELPLQGYHCATPLHNSKVIFCLFFHVEVGPVPTLVLSA